MMDDVVSTFPLLRLPSVAILNTLRIMDLLQIFGISVLSKETKNLVESLKLENLYLQVRVSHGFQVSLDVTNYSPLTIQLYHVPENRPLQELGTPARVHILHDQKWVTWTNSRSAKQLLDHLKVIFHSLGSCLRFDANCERFSLESIRKNVKDFRTIGFFSGNQELNRKILNLFEPASICLVQQSLVDFRVPRDIMIQNFDVLRAHSAQIALDDLLMSNIRYINLRPFQISAKVLNKFVKLWIKGTNPRLECLFFQFPGDFQLEELLSGLRYQNAPIGVRLFKTSGVKNPAKIPNGRDIWRVDGTKATILVVSRGDLVRFAFYVWHDHCVVN